MDRIEEYVTLWHKATMTSDGQAQAAIDEQAFDLWVEMTREEKIEADRQIEAAIIGEDDT